MLRHIRIALTTSDEHVQRNALAIMAQKRNRALHPQDPATPILSTQKRMKWMEVIRGCVVESIDIPHLHDRLVGMFHTYPQDPIINELLMAYNQLLELNREIARAEPQDRCMGPCAIL